MPLLDHFRPPVKRRLPWTSLFHGWAVRVTDTHYERMSRQYVASEQLRCRGDAGFDVSSYPRWDGADPTDRYRENLTPEERNGWVPPPPDAAIDADLTDRYEIHVHRPADSTAPVAVIAFVCPRHKDGGRQQRAFAERVATLLRGGTCVLLVDVVTTAPGNLHADIMNTLSVGMAVDLPDTPALYAATYRPAVRDGKPVIDVWTAAFGVGDPLPTMPLRLTGELFVPVEFEATYTEACRRRRLIP